MKERTVLFICKGNSGRSQMAQAFFNHFSSAWKAMSAGIRPDEKIHPWTVELMKEIGIDVNGQKPRLLTNEMLENADRIVVMDPEALEGMPAKYSSKVENWKIGILLGKPLKEVRKIRDSIEKRVRQLVEETDQDHSG